MILLDTCVVSELAKAKPDPSVATWLDSVPEHELMLSALTVGEIRKGIELLEPGPRKARFEVWLEGLIEIFGDRILPIDVDVAVRWGEISAAGRRAGRVRPPIDCLLAATAVHHGLTLATRNVSDFEDTGVRVLNPWKQSR